MDQKRIENRSLKERLSRVQTVLATLPRRKLTMLPDRFLAGCAWPSAAKLETIH